MAHPKGLLIERAQKLGLDRPEFNTAKTGPEHEPSFLTDVVLAGEVIGTGQGKSKRDSEKAAAEEALAALGQGGKDTSRKPAAKPAAKAKPTKAAAGVAAEAEPQTAQEPDDRSPEDDTFTGPWPMIDDLLAGVVQVAERRVPSDLRGDAAREAIRDFSLKLYKELLSDLGEVVEEDSEDEEEDD